jgi:serine/threonine protein kinase
LFVCCVGSEEQVRFYAAEVLSALEYLHLLGFVYRGKNLTFHNTLNFNDFLTFSLSLSPLLKITDMFDFL